MKSIWAIRLHTAAVFLFLLGALFAFVALSEVSMRQAAQRQARETLEAEAAALEEIRVEADPGVEGRPRPPAGSVVARIVVPSVGVDVVAFEGVGTKSLDRGAGHFPGTALPGEPGNSAFAAHRDLEFRGLRKVREGHRVYLDTGDATWVYRVADTRIVEPAEVAVLEARGGSDLTLITCYPFDWVGPAPRRFVVTAHLRGRFDAEDRILDDVLAGGRE